MYRRGGQAAGNGYFPDFFDIFMGPQFGAFAEPLFEQFVAAEQQAPSEDAHPPASRRFISTLPEVVVTKEDLDTETTNGECAICLSDQSIGQLATRMPCGHLFCGECLRRWLEKNNSCPVCRYEVETDDPAYETRRMQNMQNRKMRFRHRELETKSVGDLRNLMRMLKISAEGCIEKSDMIRRLEESGKIELMKTSTAQNVYSLTELMRMPVETVRRLMQGLGVRIHDPDNKTKIDLVRALANSGRIIVSTEGASAEEIADLQRQLSCSGVHAPTMAEEREPQLQRTQAATRPGDAAHGCSYSRAELEAMRISQLKQLLAARKIPTEGLIEKSDLVNRLLE